MLAFRSEAHVARWCEARRLERGAVFSLEQALGLGRAWYSERLSPTWRRATPDQAEQILSALGLTGEFWRLA